MDEWDNVTPELKNALLAAHGATTPPAAGQQAAGGAAGAAAAPPATPMHAPQMQPPQIGPQMAAAAAGPAPAPVPMTGMGMGMGGGMAMPQMGMPAAASFAAPRGTPEGDQNKLGHDLASGSGISQIMGKVEDSGFGQRHPFLGKVLGGAAQGLATLGNVGLNAVAPEISASLPGTDIHHTRVVRGDESVLEGDTANAAKEAQTGDMESQTRERDALAARAGEQTEAAAPITPTLEQATAAGVPELAGVPLSQATYQKLFSGTQATGAKKDIAADANANKVTTTGMNNDTSTANNAATNKTRESISEAANKTRMLLGEMRGTGTGSGTGAAAGTGGSFKVPADVTKRASLAANVEENAGAVESLVAERPDIVGAAGGRYTTVKQMIGSDDPAIAELGVRIHNIALASNGAHGVRSAQAIEQTENDIFNHFKSGPNAIHGALAATRASMQTFLDDEKNFSETGKRTGSGGGIVYDAKGVGHQYKGSGDRSDPSNYTVVTK